MAEHVPQSPLLEPCFTDNIINNRFAFVCLVGFLFVDSLVLAIKALYEHRNIWGPLARLICIMACTRHALLPAFFPYARDVFKTGMVDVWAVLGVTLCYTVVFHAPLGITNLAGLTVLGLALYLTIYAPSDVWDILFQLCKWACTFVAGSLSPALKQWISGKLGL
jgi:hypothetical protein